MLSIVGPAELRNEAILLRAAPPGKQKSKQVVIVVGRRRTDNGGGGTEQEGNSSIEHAATMRQGNAMVNGQQGHTKLLILNVRPQMPRQYDILPTIWVSISTC